MKKAINSLLLVLATSFSLFAQDYYDDRIDLTITSERLIQSIDRFNATGNEAELPTYIKALRKDYGLSFRKKFPRVLEINHPLAFGLSKVYALYCTPGMANSLIDEVTRTGTAYFSGVYPSNYIHTISGEEECVPNDPLNDVEWTTSSLRAIRAYEAFCISEGCSDVKIGITDVSFVLDHEDLEGKIEFYDGSGLYDPVNDESAHGLLVAGCAAAATNNGTGISAIGYNSKLLLLGMGYPEILEAYQEGATVINCSWVSGSSFTTYQESVITMVSDMGAIIVAGAGNGNFGPNCGGYQNYCYPASFDKVISVSSTTAGYGIENLWCCDSLCEGVQIANQNDKVDVFAPGYCVYTLSPEEWNYDLWGTGTSFASPTTAGLVALMKAENPNLDVFDVRNILSTTGKDVTNIYNNSDYYPSSPVPKFIDAFEAVKMAKESASVTITTPVVWTGDISVQDITIEKGGELRIESANVKLGAGAIIEVKRGARLIIDNSTLDRHCSSGEKWFGIVPHGNNYKDHETFMLDTSIPISWTDALPAVVIIRNNSHISNAREAVYLNPSADIGLDLTWEQTSKRWNALVVAENSTFENNRRSISFMKDSKPGGGANVNLSRVTNCQFITDDGLGEHGITSWAAADIPVEYCVFDGFSESGMTLGDSGFLVDNNTFRNNNYGVYAYSTNFLVPDMVISNNLFDVGNTYGVYTSTIKATEVSENNFDDCSVGFYAAGGSQYELYENVFKGGFTGIGHNNTLKGTKEEYCNVFINPMIGSYLLGDNLSVNFYKNDFSTQLNDIYLEDEVTSGKIRNQGSGFNAHWNYFSASSSTNHIKTAGTTDPFIYYYPNAGTNPRLIPQCNLSDASNCDSSNPNNYTIAGAGGTNQTCDGGLIFERLCHSTACLADIRLEIAELERNIAKNPRNKQLQTNLESLESQKDQVIQQLLEEGYKNGAFEALKTVLAAEKSEFYLKQRIDLAIKIGEYNEAKTLMNEVAKISEDNLEFQEIINLQIKVKQLGRPQVSMEDIDRLEVIAESGSSMAAPAQTLTTMLTGKLYAPVLPSVKTTNTSQTQTPELVQAIKSEREQLLVYPNPFSNQTTISYTIPENLTKVNINIVDLTGKIVATPVLNTTMNTGQHSVKISHNMLSGAGIYFVMIHHNDELVDQSKLILF